MRRVHRAHGKGYNRYTGLERTTSALAWLLARRERLLGEIQGIERFVEAAPAKIEAIRMQLDALDETIRMHEVPVDLELIKPRQLRPAVKIKLPYGTVPKAVWKLLRSNGNAPTATSEFAYFVAKKEGFPLRRKTWRRYVA